MVEAEGGIRRFEAGKNLVGIVFGPVPQGRDLILEQVGQVGTLGEQPLQDVDAEGDVPRLVALDQPDAALEAGESAAPLEYRVVHGVAGLGAHALT